MIRVLLLGALAGVLAPARNTRTQAPVETPATGNVAPQVPPSDPTPQVPPGDPAPQRAPGDAPADVPAPASPADARIQSSEDERGPLAWDGTPPADAAAFAARLAEVAAAYPQTFAFASAGRDEHGGELWYATVTRASGDERPRLPALLCAPRSQHGGDAASATALLQQCIGLAELAARDKDVESALSRAVVHALFWLRPERAFTNAPARPDELDYPAGWTFGAAKRPFPLADGATRAVCEFALAHPEIAVVAWSSGADAAPEPGTLVNVDAAASAGGSFERFVDDYLGVRSVRLFRGGATPAETRALAGAGFSPLLNALPTLTAVRENVERLRPDLWACDVRIVNVGLAGTLEGRASVREHSSVRVALAGAEIVGAALGSGAGFEPASVRAGRVELGHLAGGAARTLRLFVRGTAGANARLELTSLRAGGAAVALVLE